MMTAGVGVVLGQQLDPRPGVDAVALAAEPGGVFLLGPFRQHRRQLIDVDRAGRGGTRRLAATANT